MRLLSTSLLALTLASPALALTPQQIWDEWKPFVEMSDPESMEERTEGNTIFIENLTWKDTGGETLTIPQISIAGAGSDVIVTFPQPLSLSADNDKMEMTVTGPITLSDAEYAGVFGTMGVTWAGAIKGSLISGMENTALNISLNDVVLNAPGGDSSGNAQMTLDAGVMEMSGANMDGQGAMLDFYNAWSKATVAITKADLLHAGDPIKAISQGSDITITGTQGPGRYAIAMPNEGELMESEWDEATTNLSLTRQGFAYTATTGEMYSKVETQDPTMPNMTFNMGSTQMDILIPLFAQGQTQDARVAMDFQNLNLNFDGKSTMPQIPPGALELMKEPLNFKVDLTAGVKLNEDIWPADMNDKASPEKVGTIENVSIADLDISIGETRAQGIGALMMMGNSFDTLMPAGGEGTLTLTGAAKLLDKAMAAGLIGEQERGMGEMMLRGFAKPGETDPLTYTFKMLQDGTTTINGNPF